MSIAFMAEPATSKGGGGCLQALLSDDRDGRMMPLTPLV